jgi:hypothetical protein
MSNAEQTASEQLQCEECGEKVGISKGDWQGDEEHFATCGCTRNGDAPRIRVSELWLKHLEGWNLVSQE